jgi:hypothetical protein
LPGKNCTTSAPSAVSRGDRVFGIDM